MDLSRQYALLKDEVQDSLNQVLESSMFSGGPYVESFVFISPLLCVSSPSSTLKSAAVSSNRKMNSIDLTQFISYNR